MEKEKERQNVLFPIFQIILDQTHWDTEKLAERKITGYFNRLLEQKTKDFIYLCLSGWQLMNNTAAVIQVCLCNFCENTPVMDGSVLAQQEFLETKIELAVDLISNSVTD